MSIPWISATIGALLWLAGLRFFPLNPIQGLFLLAPLVLVPLGLNLILEPDRQGRKARTVRGLTGLQPFAGLLLWASFSQAPGPLAGALALPWVLLTFALGLAGLHRHLPHGFTDAGEVCLDAALLFLPVGGIWLMASRLGLPLMGFQEPIVMLTAMHFHFAGFTASLLTGLSGRLALPRRLYRLVAFGVLAGIPLLALGIAFAPVLEVVAAFVFALSLSTLALMWLLCLPKLAQGKIFLALSGLSVLISMGFALCFALSEFLGLTWVTIPQMVQAHGALNALGFALPGLLAFSQLRPRSRLNPAGMPFSQMVSQGFVGPRFFHRHGAVPVAPAQLPQGLVDDLTSFRRADFAPEGLAPEIRHFYEHTQDYALYVTPLWQPGFRSGGRLWRAMMEKVGQMCLPVAAEQRQDQIDSQILPLDAAVDGRPGVRAWVRTYTDTGRACYVAAYAQHRWQDVVYMNIAFTLPYSHMTSILRMDSQPGGEHQGLRLTTLFPAGETGDQGVYWVIRLWGKSLPIRLPLNETILVWKAGMPGFPELGQGTDMAAAPLLALHEMWLCGIRFLTLHYFIFPHEKP